MVRAQHRLPRASEHLYEGRVQMQRGLQTLTCTLQLFSAENASKPGTQDITMLWPVWLRTRSPEGADGIPAGKRRGQSDGGLNSNMAHLDSPSILHPCNAGVSDHQTGKQEKKAICGYILSTFYICEQSGPLRGNDIFGGTPSSRCWSGPCQECGEFPPFPMENCKHYHG